MSRCLCVLALVASVAAAQERPRLGVMLVVDQLSVDSFNARLPKTKAGFKRFVEQGLRFQHARYDAAPTLTSSGHATIATGAWAATHGVVANEWIDWETGKSTLSTEDPAFKVLDREPAKQDGTAPTFLRVPTVGDSCKVADARSRVVAISAKDRSAVLMGGKSADAAIWFDPERPVFTTSTYYAQKVPDFVTPVNQLVGAALLKKLFTWGLPGGGTTGKNPLPPKGQGRQGDSEPDVEQPELQPLLDGWEVDVALSAIKALKLGQDDAPDLLTVSFSGHDRIGHAFGPDAPEALAEFLAIDREIGRLLDGLDQQVGKGAWVAVLTSDHGVAPLPELLKERRVDAGRIDMKGLRAKLELEADTRLGAGDWFAGSKTPGLTATAQGREKLNTIAHHLRAVALKQPGVMDLLSASRVQGAAPGSMEELWRRGYVPGRSPDFVVVAKPYWVYSLGDPTGHASHWLYDRDVPLLFLGAGVRQGVAGTAQAIDVAPTFTRLLRVPTPAGAEGAALETVFR
ncbi:MAG: alkaline phosphatase family protein [Myxococcaceae bacterium]|nr:alkaline phosphatase family protein [Myxococcaceae bacterium]